MTKTQTIYTILGWLVVVLLSYIVVIQSKVNANEEILALQQRNIELDKLIQEESDWWWVDEYAIWECEESYRESQSKRNKKADEYRAEKKENEERLGLLLQR